MALLFRKSLSFLGGLLRLNFSRRGVGASVGIPGLRISVCGTQRANGRFCVKSVASHGDRCFWHR